MDTIKINLHDKEVTCGSRYVALGGRRSGKFGFTRRM